MTAIEDLLKSYKDFLAALPNDKVGFKDDCWRKYEAAEKEYKELLALGDPWFTELIRAFAPPTNRKENDNH